MPSTQTVIELTVLVVGVVLAVFLSNAETMALSVNSAVQAPTVVLLLVVAATAQLRRRHLQVVSNVVPRHKVVFDHQQQYYYQQWQQQPNFEDATCKWYRMWSQDIKQSSTINSSIIISSGSNSPTSKTPPASGIECGPKT